MVVFESFPFKKHQALACAGLHNFLSQTDTFREEKNSDDVEELEEINNNGEEILVIQDQQREHANQVRATIATDM